MPVNQAPRLQGLATSITVAAGSGPQFIDSNVVFTDADGNFNGGTLTLSGLLAGDAVSLFNTSNFFGPLIGFAGGAVSYLGTAIGSATGGVGSSFVITFNAAANTAAVDAVIQSLSFAAGSGSTSNRTLTLDVVDASGAHLQTPGQLQSFTAQTGGANLASGVALAGDATAPTFVDLNGDGKLDAVVGFGDGTLHYFLNTGSASAPVFTEASGAANPFDGVDLGFRAKVTFGDLDGDGDLDAFAGAHYGAISYFKNTGTATAPVFVQQFDLLNVDVGFDSAPRLVDLDGDGDLDVVVGQSGSTLGGDGSLLYFQNVGTSAAPNFVQRTGAANPFDALGDAVSDATPAFADVDADGDLDVVVGQNDGTLSFYENTGTATAPSFVERTGAANPFNGVDIGLWSTPTFADLNGDGALDLVVGSRTGPSFYYANQGGPAHIAVSVPAPPVVGGGGVTTGYTEHGAPFVIDAGLTVTDADSATLTGADVFIDGFNLGDVLGFTNQNGISGVYSFGELILTGSASAADYQAALRSITFASTSDTPTAFGNTRTIRWSVSDGTFFSNPVTDTINVTAVNNLPVLGGGGNTINYTALSAAKAIDTAITVADADSALITGATVTISGGHVAGDVLSLTLQDEDISSSYDASTGVLTVSGSGSAQFYRSLLRSVTFASTSDHPTAGGNTTRTISWVVNDGTDPSAAITSTINVITVNHPPSVTEPATIQATVDVATPITGIVVSDLDVGSVDLRITAGAGTLLATAGSGVTVSGAGTNQLTLEGSITDINAFIAASKLVFVSALHNAADTVLSLLVNDLANGGPGALTAAGSINLAIDDVGIGSGANDHLVGDAHDNSLAGLAGDDILEGLGGDDVLDGGTGIDTASYAAAPSAVAVTLALAVVGPQPTGGAGNDTLISIENLIGSAFDDALTGSVLANVLDGGAGNDTLKGGGGDDKLIGGAGNDVLNGGIGADDMNGGAGDDRIYVDNPGDVVTDASGADTVYSTINYTVAPGLQIETLRAQGTAGLTLTGNAFTHAIYGSAGNDHLIGGSGANVLDGAQGADLMEGGSGDDTYYVDNAGDMVIEAPGDGNDTVWTSVDFTLGAGVEVEALKVTGAAGLSLTGNEGNNVLTGGAGDDVLNGGAGANTLSGGGGIDTASYAGAVAGVTVTIKSGAQDTLGAGYDTLISIENLTGSSQNDVLTGNSAANVLKGGDGADVLNGGAGNDVLNGGVGDDSLVGGAGGVTASYAGASSGVTVTIKAGAQDTVGAGIDTLASVENLTGSDFADTLTGNVGVNILVGGSGADVLAGAGGQDTLTGGSGADSFVFKALADSAAAAPDLITDFAAGDLIDLHLIDANTLTSGNNAFHLGATAGHAGDLVVSYDSVNNRTVIDLYVDGDANADARIWLAGDHSSLAVADFVL